LGQRKVEGYQKFLKVLAQDEERRRRRKGRLEEKLEMEKEGDEETMALKEESVCGEEKCFWSNWRRRKRELFFLSWNLFWIGDDGENRKRDKDEIKTSSSFFNYIVSLSFFKNIIL
jgi:hypothetical protein